MLNLYKFNLSIALKIYTVQTFCRDYLDFSIQSLLVQDYNQLAQYYQTTKFTIPKWTGKENSNKPIELSFQGLNNKLIQTTFKGTYLTTTDSIESKTTKEEGSFCRRSFDNESGYCLMAYQCLHVIREYRLHGTKIDICTYRKNIPIICCPLAAKDVEDPRSRRLSALKCEEYHEKAKGTKFGMIRKFSGKFCEQSIPMIVGGEATQSGEYPHMAALGWSQSEDQDPKWACGGSLISEQYVLTAAHCTESGGKPPDVVRLGAHKLSSPNSQAQDIKITIIILHPKYRASLYYHDIALIKLARPVEFTEKIQPACLWQLPSLDIPRSSAAGWGRTEFMGSKSEDLQKVDLNIIDQKVCRKIYNTERRLPKGLIDGQFCAGYMEGGKDTCQGDSGGPLHAEVPEFNCVKFVIGITSFGKFCAAPNAPGVYTKIYAYLDWIEKIVFK
ncbi:serine protease snake-like isoform X2 [Episyrphus balteatus]|uniref:serine protease snake-like isoform X2 n=1 Tax=Episyrphus balteatus TaxID=286459 RepID=UPI0024850486|nr:serine protease snake-like isoform X2 [Episyrphus balteatus]